jgi:hypothetical protein
MVVLALEKKLVFFTLLEESKFITLLFSYNVVDQH